jgi:hypothetical protein
LKKLASILMTGILLFNWCGYRLLNTWMENRADRQLEARLDNNSYDESQLISIKVPSTHLSYYNSSSEFERVDGQIEVGGIQYKYVKRRLFNDSLELLCIPNQTAMRLHSAKNEFFKLVNDLQQQNGQGKKSGSHPGGSRNFSPLDFYAVTDPFILNDLYFTTLPATIQVAESISSSHAHPAEQPPDPSFLQC